MTCALTRGALAHRTLAGGALALTGGALAGGAAITGESVRGDGRAGVALGGAGTIAAIHGQPPAPTAVAAGRRAHRRIITARQPAGPRVVGRGRLERRSRLERVGGQGRPLMTGGDVERVRSGEGTIAPPLAGWILGAGPVRNRREGRLGAVVSLPDPLDREEVVRTPARRSGTVRGAGHRAARVTGCRRWTPRPGDGVPRPRVIVARPEPVGGHVLPPRSR